MEEKDYKPEGKLWFLVIFMALIFAGALLYFGKNQDLTNNLSVINGAGNSRQARVYTVYYNIGVFSPTNIRIHVGDSVKFQNDSPDDLHVVSDYTGDIPDIAGFDSIGGIPSGSVFAYTFTKAGSFGYHNDLNKTERGMVIVRQ